MAVKIRQTGGDNGLRDRFAAMTAHRLALAVDYRGIVGIGRHGQATVKTFLCRRFIHGKHGRRGQ